MYVLKNTMVVTNLTSRCGRQQTPHTRHPPPTLNLSSAVFPKIYQHPRTSKGREHDYAAKRAAFLKGAVQDTRKFPDTPQPLIRAKKKKVQLQI